MKYKVGLISLGCAKNLVDSEMILGMLNASNFEIVNSIEDSDVVVINTCGFIEDSKKESIENILDVISYHKKTVVVGCLVERYLDELKESIPEVDLWVKIKDYSHLNERLMELLEGSSIEKISPFVRLLSTPEYMAYLRISEGCNNCCTYCAIPLIRGSFKSRKFEDVIKEARDLANKGIKELVLISQDTTRYGTDLSPKTTIVDLLSELIKIKQFISIRLLYLYPDEITDELIDFVATHQDIVSPYFDIPFQHSSDSILKSMHRRGSKKEYQTLIEKIRNKIPRAIIRTTYIVGFPGETEDDFVDLVSFTKKNKFDHMGAFAYSREDGTVSFDYPNQVEDALKKGRLNKIMEVQKKISYSNNKEHIGEVMNGIVTNHNKDSNVYELRSYWNAPDDIDGKISFTSNKALKVGDEVKVKITNAFIYDLFGELID